MVVGSVPVIQNLSILQPFLLPACLIAATAAAAVSGRLFVGGALLAAATVKPQICVLPVGWFILWTCSDWKHRRSFFLGFVVALAALVVASAWLMPSWLMKYPEVLKSYAEYTKATSFLGARLPSPLRWPVEILALAAVASYCWRARRQAADSAPFAMALAFVLALTVLIIPTVVQPFNHVLLLPAVLLGIAHWQELRRGNLAMRSVALVFAICALLPWLFAVGAVLNPVAVRPDWLLKLWSLPVAASMLLPFAAFGMLILLQKLVPVQPTSPQATLAPLKPVGLAAPKGHA
jgi:hypothetical protein